MIPLKIKHINTYIYKTYKQNEKGKLRKKSPTHDGLNFFNKEVSQINQKYMNNTTEKWVKYVNM